MTRTHCTECGAVCTVLSLADDCWSCGETVGVTCRDCGELTSPDEMTNDRCERCAEERAASSSRERRNQIRAEYADYRRERLAQEGF